MRLLLCLLIGLHWATASVSANPLPAEVQQALPATRALGLADLKFWGFAVYRARLWVAADFRVEHYAQHAFGLELVYGRAFESRDIVARSLDEMRRMGEPSSEQFAQWREWLGRAIPNVAKGDRLLAIHRPFEGIEFLHNGRPTGTIRDAQFARRFLDIWLSISTSEPKLRQDLLTLKLL